jgi:hypothetical protein
VNYRNTDCFSVAMGMVISSLDLDLSIPFLNTKIIFAGFLGPMTEELHNKRNRPLMWIRTSVRVFVPATSKFNEIVRSFVATRRSKF